MRTIAQILAGSAGGGSFGYLLADGLDPLIPLILLVVACLFVVAAMTLLAEKDARRG